MIVDNGKVTNQKSVQKRLQPIRLNHQIHFIRNVLVRGSLPRLLLLLRKTTLRTRCVTDRLSRH